MINMITINGIGVSIRVAISISLIFLGVAIAFSKWQSNAPQTSVYLWASFSLIWVFLVAEEMIETNGTLTGVLLFLAGISALVGLSIMIWWR